MATGSPHRVFGGGACLALVPLIVGWSTLDPLGARSSASGLSTPRLRSDFHRGVNHAHVHRRGRGYGSSVSAAELAALRRIGVDSITLTPFAYQRTATADRVAGFPGHATGRGLHRSDPTMTDDDLAAEIANAQQLAMRVVLKPHIWSHDFRSGVEWHGTIRQTSADAHMRWWDSYQAFVLHYAVLAERHGVDALAIGTELVTMTLGHPKEWKDLIVRVRGVYRGALTYVAHHGREFEEIGFWSDLDMIGLGAYFPLDAPNGAGVGKLVRAWRPHRRRIEAVQARLGRPVVFFEIGYRPVSDAHQRPWEYDGGRLDLTAQSRSYEALFQAFSDADWWHGVYFWKTFTDPRKNRGHRPESVFSFRHRPAEAVVRRWFGGSGESTIGAE